MIELKQNPRAPVEAPFSLKLNDIYYILFRRKWLILSFLALGVISALAVYSLQKPLYFSEAKLMVRYVVDTKSVEAGAGNSVRSTDMGGDSVLNSELEILTSLDLCEDVVTLVGAEKILGKGNSNVTVAASAVSQGLTVENPRRSNIIKVRFAHGNPEVCQVVLRQLIEAYFKRHKEVHRAAGSYDDVLTQQSQNLLVRIRADEDELRKLKAQAGVISVEDAKKSLTDRMSRLQQELFEAEAQLAECTVMSGLQPKAAEKPSEPPPTPQEKISEYKTLLGRIDSLRAREFALAENYKDEYPQLKTTREQLAENERRRKALEEEFPRLAEMPAVATTSTKESFSEFRPDRFRVPALETKIRVLTNQIAMVRGDISVLDSVEAQISEVERRLKLNLQNYMQYSAGVEAIRFNDAMGAVKMSNIQPVQTPSPPALNVSKRFKVVAGTFFGLFLFGLAMAFGYELLVDHTVRKPGDFEAKFKMPLFLSIPKLRLNGHAKQLPSPCAEVAQKENGKTPSLRETWASDHPLRPFVDGLRDRTLIHFGGDPHKPKLIGVTSCSKGSGVTSMAAGLAGALSETGDGNVLLLNLNFDSQGVHPFSKGELTCGLSDALELHSRENGKVLNNLYVATAGNPADPDTQNLSKQLARAVPRLRVSDYEYIVFDLPPTSPTTPTARLGGMMDLVILVVESEKDSQDAVKQASQLLARAKAPVSAVLNKVRNPVPRWLSKGPEVVSS